MWVPSYTGITGNEEVDLLANQAISSPGRKPPFTIHKYMNGIDSAN